MSHIVIKHADGSIAVTHMTPEFMAMAAKQGLTEEQALNFHINELQTRGQVAPDDVVVGKSEIKLPTDRDFRGAWRFVTADPTIDICPHTACELVKNKLRAERAPELAKLDVAFQRALEEGNVAKQAEVAAKKQQLRDVTNTVPAVPEGMQVADNAFLDTLRAVKLPQV